jgi:hypothetical protein
MLPQCLVGVLWFPKSLIVRSSQVFPPELQINREDEESEGGYQSDYLREVGDECLQISGGSVKCNGIYDSDHGKYS